VTGVLETIFEGDDVPTPFIAKISKSYDWPFVRPVIVLVVNEALVVAT
jgi:hypothetical protein